MKLNNGFIWWTGNDDEVKGKLIGIQEKHNRDDAWYGVMDVNGEEMKFNITSLKQQEFYSRLIGEYLVLTPYENLRGVAVKEHTPLVEEDIRVGIPDTVMSELLPVEDSTDIVVNDYLCERIHKLEIELEVLKQLKACWDKG